MTDPGPVTYTVYVVKIVTKTLHPTVTIGAVYTQEEDAKSEVESLNGKNKWTTASYCTRLMEIK